MENHRHPLRIVSLAALLLFILAACQPAAATPSLVPGQETIPTAPRLLTAVGTPQEPSPTDPSPTELPNIISQNNIDQIEPINQLSQGTITNPVLFSPAGDIFAVPATTGVFLYDSHSFEELAFLETKSMALNICFSPDGTQLAISGSTNTVQIWNTKDATLLDVINISASDSTSIFQIGYSPDGNFLAVAYGPNNIVELWGVQNRELNFKYPGDLFSFSPDAKFLATTEFGMEDMTKRTIHLFDLINHAELNSWHGVKGFFFSEDQLAIQRGDSVQLLNVVSDTAMLPMEGTQAAISLDGQKLAVFKSDVVILYDLPRGAISQVMDGRYGSVEELHFSADRKYLLGLVSNAPAGCCVSGPDKLEVWQVVSGNNLLELSLDQFSRWSVISPDGQYLVSADVDHIDFVLISNNLITHTIDGFTSAVQAITFSPDSQNLAAAYFGPQSVRIWNRNGDVVKIFRDENNPNLGTPSSLAFSPDGNLLAGNAGFWNPLIGPRISNLELKLFENKPVITSVAFHPVQKSLAAGFSDGSLRFWDYRANKLLHELRRFNGELVNLAFSQDGSMIAVVQAYPNFTVQVWRYEQYYPRILDLRGAYFRQAIFSPDGKNLAVLSTSKDQNSELTQLGQVEVWNLVDRKEILRIRTNNIVRIAYSPDGKLLAGGLIDQGAVQIWDASTGDLLRTLKGHIGNVIDVAFSADGTLLGSAASDGTIILWGVP